jgi:serine/threonine protein kinase
MELLRGEDLRSLLRGLGKLSVAEAVRIVRQAARGVAAAHRAGIIHRDLKPENLFLARREGDEERCKVLDFGVAKTETSELTQTGTVLGTIKYMAPEQLEDSASVGPATDVYALGVILYECLTGDAPFAGNSAQETMLKILTAPLRSVRERRPDVPAELAAVVDRALARPLAQRYQSSEELSLALEPFAALPEHPALRDVGDLATADLSSADAAPLPSFRPVVRTPSTMQSPASTLAIGRRRTLLAGGSLALLLALVGAWWMQREPEVTRVEPLRSEQAKSPASTAQAPGTALTRPSDLPSALPVSVPAESDKALAAHGEPDPAPEVRAPAHRERPRPARPAAKSSAAGAPHKNESNAGAGGLPNLRLDRDNPYGQ